MSARNAAVLVQIHSMYLREIHLAGLVHLDQFLVDGDRSSTGGEAQLGIGFLIDQIPDHLCDDRTGLIVAVGNDYFHAAFSLLYKIKRT